MRLATFVALAVISWQAAPLHASSVEGCIVDATIDAIAGESTAEGLVLTLTVVAVEGTGHNPTSALLGCPAVGSSVVFEPDNTDDVLAAGLEVGELIGVRELTITGQVHTTSGVEHFRHVERDFLGRGAHTAQDTGACVDLILSMRASGGLTPHGLGQSQLWVRVDGTAWFDDEAPEPARAGPLPEELAAQLRSALSAVDAAALAEGYGECCAAHVDGSDVYLAFPDRPQGEVRISSLDETPETLRAVVAAAGAALVHVQSHGTPTESAAWEPCPQP